MRTRSQRLLSMVMALSMLLTFLPVSAFAEGTPPPTRSVTQTRRRLKTTILVQSLARALTPIL